MIYRPTHDGAHLILEDGDRQSGNRLWRQSLAPVFDQAGSHVQVDISRVSAFSSLLLGRLIRLKLDIERFGGRLSLHPAKASSALPSPLSWQSFFTPTAERACHTHAPNQPDPKDVKARKHSGTKNLAV